jgi:hypothetical protein
MRNDNLITLRKTIASARNSSSRRLFFEIILQVRTSLELLLILFERVTLEGIFWSVQFDLEGVFYLSTS